MEKEYINVERMLILNYKKLGLNDDEVVILLLTYALIKNGTEFINPSDIALFSSFSVTKIDVVFSSLCNKGWIKTEIDDEGKARTDVDYLIERLYGLLLSNYKKEEKSKSSNDNKEIYLLFENFFARPLSPLEYDIINGWIKEKISYEQIKAALEIAKLSTNHSIRYIDTILYEEKRKQEMSEEEYDKSLQETIELSKIDWLNK